jgi:hypothetical protein
VPLTMVLPPLALLALGLGLGLAPGTEEHAAVAAAAFSDRAAYAASVLGTHSGSIPTGGRIVVPASPAASAGGVLTDLGQVLAALCVAGIALDRRALRLRRTLAVGTGWLRRLHSGLVGDQVTWLCSPPSASGRCTDREPISTPLPRSGLAVRLAAISPPATARDRRHSRHFMKSAYG